jgi:tRNA threonylcarbamoyladenosine biosynthesis protein TsaB
MWLYVRKARALSQVFESGWLQQKEWPLVSVPTLDCFAYRFAFLSTPVIPLINAKKHRFYAALYQEGKQKTDYLDADMEEINALVSQYTEVILTGPDASAFRELYPERDYLLDPLASLGCAHDLIHLGETRYQSVGPDDTTEGPLYIRKSDAELLFEKKKQ